MRDRNSVPKIRNMRNFRKSIIFNGADARRTSLGVALRASLCGRRAANVTLRVRASRCDCERRVAIAGAALRLRASRCGCELRAAIASAALRASRCGRHVATVALRASRCERRVAGVALWASRCGRRGAGESPRPLSWADIRLPNRIPSFKFQK
jgi:hypothetical protein